MSRFRDQCAVLSIIRSGACRSNPFGSSCKNYYTAGGTDQVAATINATGPKVAAVLQAPTSQWHHAPAQAGRAGLAGQYSRSQPGGVPGGKRRP